MAIRIRYHDEGVVGERLRAIVQRRADLIDEILAGEPGAKELFVDLHYDVREDAIHAHLTLDVVTGSLRADASANDPAVALTSALATLCRAARDRTATDAA